MKNERCNEDEEASRVPEVDEQLILDNCPSPEAAERILMHRIVSQRRV